MNVYHNELALFLQKHINCFSEEILRVHDTARTENIPVIRLETANFINTICALKKPKKILEIGTAVGFSTAVLSDCMANGGKILTIEKDGEMIRKAKLNFDALGISDRIQIICGDAVEALMNIDDSFDLIFLDAAKGQYINLLQDCNRLLNAGGILLADDIMQGGTICLPLEEINKKNKTIHKRMNRFIDEVLLLKELETSLLPIGDGLLFSVKSE